MTKKRSVSAVESARAEIVKAAKAMSDKCVSGMLMMLELLEDPSPEVQPDLEDRCGLLSEGKKRHEVYALQLPGCRTYRLVISVPERDMTHGPITLHGPLRATTKTCENAATLAARHLGLRKPVWEPANEP